MKGTADIFTSRRANYEECRYRKRALRPGITLDEVSYENRDPDGVFYAREAGAYVDSMNRLDAAVSMANTDIAIQTSDDVSNLAANDHVEFGGSTRRVVSVQRTKIRRMSAYDREGTFLYVIQLKG